MFKEAYRERSGHATCNVHCVNKVWTSDHYKQPQLLKNLLKGTPVDTWGKKKELRPAPGGGCTGLSQACKLASEDELAGITGTRME